jgi:hypothetical protein
MHASSIQPAATTTSANILKTQSSKSSHIPFNSTSIPGQSRVRIPLRHGRRARPGINLTSCRASAPRAADGCASKDRGMNSVLINNNTRILYRYHIKNNMQLIVQFTICYKLLFIGAGWACLALRPSPRPPPGPAALRHTGRGTVPGVHAGHRRGCGYPDSPSANGESRSM